LCSGGGTAYAATRRALARRELGAGFAYRQSLVDLASVCELLAGELPEPRIANRQAVAERARGAV